MPILLNYNDWYFNNIGSHALYIEHNIPRDPLQKYVSYYNNYTYKKLIWIMIHQAFYAIYKAQTHSNTCQNEGHIRMYVI